MATNRNRVIYQSEALFVKDMALHGSLSASDQLLRVQDISHGVELNRVDVNEFGQLAAIERKIVEPPTVSLDFSYYIHGGRNEKLLGLNETVDHASTDTTNLKQALSGWLIGDQGKNYYISVVGEGDDNAPIDPGAGHAVIGIGNGYVTSFNVEAAVGDIPSSSVSVEANNIQFTQGANSVDNPGVDLNTGASIVTGNGKDFPQAAHTGSTDQANAAVTCLRPGDVYVNFNDKGECLPADATGDTPAEAADATITVADDYDFNDTSVLTIPVLKADGTVDTPIVFNGAGAENIGTREFKHDGTKQQTADSITAVVNGHAKFTATNGGGALLVVTVHQVQGANGVGFGAFTEAIVESGSGKQTATSFANGVDFAASEIVGGDPEVQMGGAIVEGAGACHIQNFTIDVPVARTPLQRIGSTFPYAREVDVPMNITLSISAILGDLDPGSLNDLLCGSDKKRNIRIFMRQPCSDPNNTTEDVVMEYLIKGAQLDSQNFSATIGDNKTVDMVFTAQLAGANGTSSGLFFWADTNTTGIDAGVVQVPTV